MEHLIRKRLEIVLARTFNASQLIFFFQLAIPGLFLVCYSLFKQALQFLQQINVKNVHPVGILCCDSNPQPESQVSSHNY